MTLKEYGMQMVIDAQAKIIASLKEENHKLAYRNLLMKTHMEVICSHPVGLATKMIARKYSRDRVTKELQLAAQN